MFADRTWIWVAFLDQPSRHFEKQLFYTDQCSPTSFLELDQTSVSILRYSAGLHSGVHLCADSTLSAALHESGRASATES